MKTIKDLFSIILFLPLNTKASKSLRSFFIRYFFESSTGLSKLLDDSSVQLSSIEDETKQMITSFI